MSIDHSDDGSFVFDALATAVLDEHCTVLGWSRSAADLVERTAGEVCGRPVRELLADVPSGATSGAGFPAAGRARLRHRSGGMIDVTFRVVRMEGVSDRLVLAVPTPHVSERNHGVSLMRALFSQDLIGIGIHDTNLSLVRTNVRPEMIGGPAVQPGSSLRELLSTEDAQALESALREVLKTGVPLVNKDQRMRTPRIPGRERAFSLSAFRLEDARGSPTGVVSVFTDITEQLRARRHLRLVHEAALRVGGSLDVARIAQELADVAVPALGDLASVDLAEPVLAGDEPSKWQGGGELHLRKVAVASATGEWPAGHVQLGEVLPRWPDASLLRKFQRGETLVARHDELIAALGGDQRLVEKLLPPGGHSAIGAPLSARGLWLGHLSIWRVDQPDPFTGEDANLVKEIASRGALAIDNARRYTREHREAVALQQRLLPPPTTDTPAAETASIYRPAGGGAEISGDWFDVIPLPSLRMALVVGDVVGHGLHATATMGRLRTAIHTLADLELGPDELLTRVEDLVQRLAAEAPMEHQDAVGATCLYAVYDPVTRRCVLASAGHPPPVVVRPDGTSYVVELSPGPPLAVGGMPYETTTIDLDPGSVLALYTDGLIERDGHDPDAGLRHFTATLPGLCHPDRPLEEAGRTLLAGLGDQPLRDDIACLLARTRAVPAENTACWEFPADPAAVADARKATAGQLGVWGLDEMAFTTELVISELVTNAIRYGGAPVGLRLIRGEVLVCEVTDPSNTQPRLQRALLTDEGGRGLFLVAQLTTRWGCRYGQQGKTIWGEQPLEEGNPVAFDLTGL